MTTQTDAMTATTLTDATTSASPTSAPAAAPKPGAGRIVVGIDGSESSKAALRWAVRQARLAGATLRVVMTWEVPTFAYASGMPYPGDLDLAGASRRTLDKAIGDVVGARDGLEVSSVVVESHPALALLAEAVDAELLVVGTRGHGAFAGMLLGSVSEHCVAHSTCPVVVVPSGPAPA